MNSYDLFISALKGEAERIPFPPFILQLAAELTNIDNMTEFCRIPEKQAEAQLKTAKFFGMDSVKASFDAFREANTWGVELNWSGRKK